MVRLLWGILFMVASVAPLVYAAEGSPHLDRDEAFRYIRTVMPQFAALQQEVGEALRDRRAADVESGTAQLAALLQFTSFGPTHRNMDRLRAMNEVGDRLRGDLEETARQARLGDFDAADRAFQSARGACTDCHARLRDLP